MADRLTINLDYLLHQRRVAGKRIEYKAGWNPNLTIHTLCAFAKENVRGGYVVIAREGNAKSQSRFPLFVPTEYPLDTMQQPITTLGKQIIHEESQTPSGPTAKICLGFHQPRPEKIQSPHPHSQHTDTKEAADVQD